MAYSCQEPTSVESKTDWIFGGVAPRLEIVEYGAKDNPSYKKILWIQFRRYRLYKGISGQFAYDLGQTADANEVDAYTGTNRVEAYIYGATNPDFVCVADEYTTEVPYSDCTRRTQVWQSKAPIEALSWPT